jgi:hypothetical protein
MFISLMLLSCVYRNDSGDFYQPHCHTYGEMVWVKQKDIRSIEEYPYLKNGKAKSIGCRVSTTISYFDFEVAESCNSIAEKLK